jgi:hypothetical protein
MEMSSPCQHSRFEGGVVVLEAVAPFLRWHCCRLLVGTGIVILEERRYLEIRAGDNLPEPLLHTSRPSLPLSFLCLSFCYWEILEWLEL